MIGKVQLNNKPSFGAKFYNYPHCLTNPEIKEKFQKATKEYPDYVLSQENISFFDKDQFYLFKRGEVIVFDTDYLTSLKSLRKNNHSVDDTVKVLVSIFNKMVKNVK